METERTRILAILGDSASTYQKTNAYLYGMSNTLHQQYLDLLGIESFNNMQQDFFKLAEKGHDLVLLAPTGTGKTLAYMIPMVAHLNQEQEGIQALIILPSRELAIQTEQVFKTLRTPYKVSTCYGGHDVKTEKNSLLGNPSVVIGTQGRIADHIKRGNLNLEKVDLVVLDEFDKALQYGFHEQIRQIFSAMGTTQKHWLTSATNLRSIPDFIPIDHPKTLNHLNKKEESQLELKVLRTDTKEKAISLMRLLSTFQDEASLVFCNHREAVTRISQLLTEEGFSFSILHGGLDQLDREKNLIKFRSGVNNILIATDLAARGLDIPEIKHVVHYQLPPKPDAYIHRNGRTARMHASGESYLVLSDDDILPDYIPEDLPELTLPDIMTPPVFTRWSSVYFSVGKKEKISKGDIVGFLTQKGQLSKDDIGLITVLDHSAYAAVASDQLENLLRLVKGEKIKNNKAKIEEAR
jgi:superfamily II DNA/RNA helicase